MPYFQKYFNLLLIELRGHGNTISRENETPYTFDSVAEDLIEVLDFHGIQKAHFIGLSIGSLIIHVIHDKNPLCVRSITGTGGIYGITWQIHWFSKMAYILASIFPYNFLYVLFAYIVMPRKNHAISRKVFIKASKKLHRREYLRWLNLYGSFRKTVRNIDFKKNPIPVLIVMGSEDYLFLKPARLFASYNDMALLKVIEGAGHICNIEKPEVYNRLVHKFIQEEVN